MSIKCIQLLKLTIPMQSHAANKEMKQKQIPKSSKIEITENKVNLRNAQAFLMQTDKQDIDKNSVAMLKQAIRDGSLQINIGKIADALIKDNQDFF